MRFFCVYVLSSLITDYIYVGITTNVYKRFKEHNDKKYLPTNDYAPFDLIYFEGYKYLEDAKKRVKYLDTVVGRESLKKLLERNFNN